MDAEDFSECPISQFEEIWILRELNKAVVGFDSPEDCVRLSPLGESRAGSPDAVPSNVTAGSCPKNSSGSGNGASAPCAQNPHGDNEHSAGVKQNSPGRLACRKAVSCLQDLAPGLPVSLDEDTVVRLCSLEAKTRDDSRDDNPDECEKIKDEQTKKPGLLSRNKSKKSVDDYVTCYEDSDEFQSASSSIDLQGKQI